MLFKLENFIKFSCKQFQFDFNKIFTIFYKSSSRKEIKRRVVSSLWIIYSREKDSERISCNIYLFTLGENKEGGKDERILNSIGWNGSEMKKIRLNISNLLFHQSWVSGHEWIWQLNVFFLVSSLPSSPSSYLPLSPLLTVNPSYRSTNSGFIS